MRNAPPDGGARLNAYLDGGPRLSSISPRPAQRFRLLARRLHRFGPRPVGEMLLALQRQHGIADADLIALMERFAAVDPDFLAALGEQDWPRPLAIMEGGRR